MPIDPPDLDSRRFADLVEEARQRIPRYAPEWTNLNDSDPGMTLVKLHAWMTETILYELNRVPDLNYVAFLNLVGVTPFPARPARAELTFTLDKLDKPSDPLAVYLPKGVQVAVDDPELEREVVFETDRSATAINAAIAIALAPAAPDTDEGVASQNATVTHSVVASFDEKAGAALWPHPFAPFGAKTETGAYSIIGLMLRRTLAQPAADYSGDVFPSAPLDLYVDLVDVDDRKPDGELLAEASPSYSCPVTQGQTAAGAQVEWQIFVGSVGDAELFEKPRTQGGWVKLETTDDGTLGLTRSGHVVLEIPREATRISPRALPRTFWKSFSHEKPPADFADLEDTLHDDELAILGGLEDKDWLAMGVPEDDVEDIVACGEAVDEVENAIGELTEKPDPSKLSAQRWAEIEPLFDSPFPLDKNGRLRPMYWLRVVCRDQIQRPVIRAIRLNTISATQATTRLDERLGRSNGRPGQVLRLQKTPVLLDPDKNAPTLDLEVTEAGETRPWTRVDSVLDVKDKAEARVYTLDPTTGEVRFEARTPVAGAEVVARRYRVGGGAIGNVAPGTISALKGKIAGVKSVSNTRRAHGGRDAETLEAAKARAPRHLRMRERAVSADDFAELALRTRGVAMHKAYALARTAPDASDPSGFVRKDGAVTLVVLTRSDKPKPLPTEAELRAVCEELEPRRLVTTELHVARPRYVEIRRLAARLTVRPDYDLRTVSDAAAAELLRFLDPIRGGADGTGWPFGEDVYHGDLYDLLLGVAGVQRVSGLELSLDGAADTDPLQDVTAIPDGSLPFLPRAALGLEARYA